MHAMHCHKFQNAYRHHVLVGIFTSVTALALTINFEDLAVNRAREQDPLL